MSRYKRPPVKQQEGAEQGAVPSAIEDANYIASQAKEMSYDAGLNIGKEV